MVSELGQFASEDAARKCLNPCFSGGWSRSCSCTRLQRYCNVVLILVLVEDGLGDLAALPNTTTPKRVLILVLVEDGLGAPNQGRMIFFALVLILVLVEDGLGAQDGQTVAT